MGEEQTREGMTMTDNHQDLLARKNTLVLKGIAYLWQVFDVIKNENRWRGDAETDLMLEAADRAIKATDNTDELEEHASRVMSIITAHSLPPKGHQHHAT